MLWTARRLRMKRGDLTPVNACIRRNELRCGPSGLPVLRMRKLPFIRFTCFCSGEVVEGVGGRG